jgi:uncharacterized protein (TIGR03000 family)
MASKCFNMTVAIVLLTANGTALASAENEQPVRQYVADKATPARITVRLPVTARLFIDEVAVPRTGATRAIISPPLEAGSTYYYMIRAEINSNGKLFRKTKKVLVRAGETTIVDFGDMGLGRGPARRPEPIDVERRTEKQPFKLSGMEMEILELTNRDRKKAGVPPLAPNARLFQAARRHSANMARQEKLDHILDDKAPDDRIRASGYRAINWGENIAFGQRTAAQVLDTWMNSEGHRKNILNEDFTEIGIGVAISQDGLLYFTQVFGRRAN